LFVSFYTFNKNCQHFELPHQKNKLKSIDASNKNLNEIIFIID